MMREYYVEGRRESAVRERERESLGLVSASLSVLAVVLIYLRRSLLESIDSTYGEEFCSMDEATTGGPDNGDDDDDDLLYLRGIC